MCVRSLRENFYRRSIRSVKQQLRAPLEVILLARVHQSRPFIFPYRFQWIT